MKNIKVDFLKNKKTSKKVNQLSTYSTRREAHHILSSWKKNENTNGNVKYSKEMNKHGNLRLIICFLKFIFIVASYFFKRVIDYFLGDLCTTLEMCTHLLIYVFVWMNVHIEKRNVFINRINHHAGFAGLYKIVGVSHLLCCWCGGGGGYIL